jgi:hypothetical protein
MYYSIESKNELSLLCYPWKVGLFGNGVSAVIVTCSLPSLSFYSVLSMLGSESKIIAIDNLMLWMSYVHWNT